MIARSVTADADIWGAVLERARNGDEGAFERIVAAHHADMARIAYLVCGDLDVAEEAEQAAWARVWHRLPDVRDPLRLRPWLMSVCVNEARQIVRSQRRRTVRELAVASVETHYDPDRAGLIDLANALAGLDTRDRALLGLRYLAGLDSEEIGRAVGMSASGVRVRLARLLLRLRQELGDD
jgi:RNA polymerase sigma factor (sigma-70 family)